MKLAFITAIFLLPNKANGVLKLLLFFTAYLTGTQDLAPHKHETCPEPDINKEINHAKKNASAACMITDMVIGFQGNCNVNGTDADWTDDYYEANYDIHFTGVTAGDKIEVIHPYLFEQPTAWEVIEANEVTAGFATLWANKMHTDIDENNPLPRLIPRGTFTINIKDNAGAIKCTKDFTFTNKHHERPCSVCTVTNGNWNSTTPACWLDETPHSTCEHVLNFTPDAATSSLQR